MTRSIRIIATVAALTTALAIMAATPVAAGAPSDVTIVSHMNFNQNGFNYGDFRASGAAVDQGLMCASGTVDDTRLIFAGSQSTRGAQIPVRKTFTCDDGSGQIFIQILVHLDFATSTETFSWAILGGTGAYGGLNGSGQGSTVSDGSDPQTGNFNTYTGFIVS
jgi:hypothetical protein